MPTTPPSPTAKDHSTIVESLMFSQREFLLNLSESLEKGNVSFAEFYLLCFLPSSRGLSFGKIARKMGYSIQNTESSVDRVRKLGYVECNATDDRSKTIVSITPKGIELVAGLRSTLKALVAKTMGDDK